MQWNHSQKLVSPKTYYQQWILPAKIITKLNYIAYFDMWKSKEDSSCRNEMQKRVTTCHFIICNKNCFNPKWVTWSQFVFSVNFTSISISIPSTRDTKMRIFFSSALKLKYRYWMYFFRPLVSKLINFATILIVEYHSEAFWRLKCLNHHVKSHFRISVNQNIWSK